MWRVGLARMDGIGVSRHATFHAETTVEEAFLACKLPR